MKKKKTIEKQIKISLEIDVSQAAIEARSLAETAGFSQNQQYMVSTAVSELARNMFLYALKGKINIRILHNKTQKGIEIIAEDDGPGIVDIGKALEDNFSTGASLGLGLPGVKRLMDEFMIDTERGRGTKITVRKWV